MTTHSVRLPDIGEGVTQAEVVEWHVQIGDYVYEDGVLASVMTDKATVEIPSLFSGTVVWIGGGVGDTLAIGSELVKIDTAEKHAKIMCSPEVRDQPQADADASPDASKSDLRASDTQPQAKSIIPILLPDVGEGVTEAELVEWHVKVGDVIREDELLAAVMTDKATVEIPSLYDGVVVELGGQIGDIVRVGASLVLIETAQSAHEAESAPVVANTAATAPQPSKVDGSLARAVSAAVSAQAPALAVPLVHAARLGTQAGVPRPEGSAALASPAVRARARNAGFDLRQVAGSGPAGRITQADLDLIFAAPSDNRDVGSGRFVRAKRTGTREIEVVGMRRKIAERMALANSRIPHITVVEEIDVTAFEDLRDKLNATRGARPKLTVLPFVTAALSRAFVDHPEMNAHYDDEAGVVIQHEAVHLGIATMTDSGLAVPVLRHAETSSLFEAAAEIARLSAATRDGKASRSELSGSTFTVSSLGPLGAVATTPIINLPEVAILGINKMAIRPMWDGSQFQPRKVMNISASFDHRVIDGWNAAVFIQKLKSLLETPALIFVDYTL